MRFRFVDSAGLPIARVAYEMEAPDGAVSRGRLAENGLVSGSGWEAAGTATVQLFTVGNLCWSAEEAPAAEPVTLTAETTGFEDGTPAPVVILESDLSRPETAIDVLAGEVSGNRIELEWTYRHPEDEPPYGAEAPGGYSRPRYRFEVQVGPVSARSGFLKLTDTLEIEVQDAEGNALAGEPYEVRTPEGAILTGELDDEGRASLEEASIRTSRIRLPGVPHGDLRAERESS